MVEFNPIEALLSIMNIPKAFNLVNIVKTTDGHFIGMEAGDIGYNHFLGKPSAPHVGAGRDRTLSIWESLTPQERRAVYLVAKAKNIDLTKEFGVPELSAV